jgi:hypothetical protein
MIEVVPFMLFILGWHPDRPGEIDLERPEIVYLSKEECEAQGARIAAAMTKSASDKSGANYTHRCVEMPSREEFDKAFKALKERRQ